MSDWWVRKIVGLLHDPPDKVLDIPGHKNRALTLTQNALRGLPGVAETGMPDAAWQDAAKRADAVAAAADRLGFPQGVQVRNWLQTPLILHPLSGQEQVVEIKVSPAQAHDKQAEVVKKLVDGMKDPKLRFLKLWRLLERRLMDGAPEACWSQLPADTRIPDHPLLHHARVASAFAVCPKPASLLFTIGPVQRFIATARKTQDLWMGSYLLSYLIWHAIQVLAEELGPDHILFPSLHGQPLADWWLSQKGILTEPPPAERLRLATLPNRFLAIVPAPAKDAVDLAKEAEKKVKNAWKELAKEVFQARLQKVRASQTAKGIWNRQIDSFPEIYWAVYIWDDRPEDIANRYKELTGASTFRPVLEALGKYPPNQATVYSACYALTERALGARKSTRDFRPSEEPGQKCSLCGEREVLHDEKDRQGREFWKEVAEEAPGRVEADGSERLCGVCAVKRFAPEVLKERLGLRTGFPSTDSIAAAPFTEKVLQNIQNEAVRKIVEQLVEELPKRIPSAKTGMSIPKLDRLAEEKGFQRLTELDGEWFYEESYDPDRLGRRHGVRLTAEELAKIRDRVRDLRKALNTSPSDYYAILLMDGDRMGEWLSGAHEGLPKVEELLHPEAREQMKEEADRDPAWRELLSRRRLVSPSLHAAISQALANFALHCVPFVIEERHAGRLVYAGGDDVLALLPARDALPAARALRALFSGEARLQANGDIHVDFGDSQWTGWLDWKGRRLVTMGRNASASVGIVVAHRLHPLRDALAQVRAAEEAAKELYCRNAICVRWLKRSGEQVQMGAKFYYDGVLDTLALLGKVLELMETGKDGVRLSGRFPNALMEAAFVVSHLPLEAQKAELRRLLWRHSEGTSQQKDKVLGHLAEKLGRLAQALDEHRDKADPHDLTRPQPGLVELAKWLTLLRFIAGGSA